MQTTARGDKIERCRVDANENLPVRLSRRLRVLRAPQGVVGRLARGPAAPRRPTPPLTRAAAAGPPSTCRARRGSIRRWMSPRFEAAGLYDPDAPARPSAGAARYLDGRGATRGADGGGRRRGRPLRAELVPGRLRARRAAAAGRGGATRRGRRVRPDPADAAGPGPPRRRGDAAARLRRRRRRCLRAGHRPVRRGGDAGLHPGHGRVGGRGSWTPPSASSTARSAPRSGPTPPSSSGPGSTSGPAPSSPWCRR